MIETTITRNVVYLYGGIEADVEVVITVEGRVDNDGQAEIVRAYRYDREWEMENETELIGTEEARALSQLQAMVPEYLAGLAQKAVDDRTDEARGK